MSTTDAIIDAESAIIDLKAFLAALEIARQHRGASNAESVDLVVDVLLPLAVRQAVKVQEAIYAIPTKQPVASAEDIQESSGRE
jgi:hypothetical protein